MVPFCHILHLHGTWKSWIFLRRSRFAKKVSAEGAFRESVRERVRERERPWSTTTTGIPSAEASPLISRLKKSFCWEESGLMCCKSRESSRIIAAKVTSLQDLNISRRTVAENQTELESSGRPGDRSRSKSVKDLRVKRLLEFTGLGSSKSGLVFRRSRGGLD